MQSLPLLYGWVVMVATNPMARNILVDVAWRIALVIAAAAVAEYGLRRTMRPPIRRLESLAPPVRVAESDASVPTAETEDDAVARAEAGDIEAPVKRRPYPTAWTLLKRVPLVLARLALELVPVLGIVLIGHLFAGSSLGGQTVSRLIILAVVDSYAICVAVLCVLRMLLSPDASRLRLFLFHLRDSTATYLMYWAKRLIVIGVLGYATGEVGLLLGLSEIAHDALEKGVGSCCTYSWPTSWCATGGRAPVAARTRRRHGCPRPCAQQFCPDLALGRVVLPDRALADLGHRGATRVRRRPTLFYPHRLGADRRASGPCWCCWAWSIALCGRPRSRPASTPA